jgi:hypothetical protein
MALRRAYYCFAVHYIHFLATRDQTFTEGEARQNSRKWLGAEDEGKLRR